MEKSNSKKKIAVFISGKGSNLKNLYEFSKKKVSKFTVALVISNKKNVSGISFSKLKKINSICIEKNLEQFEAKAYLILKKKKIDIICLAGFMKILSKDFIKKVGIPILNIHPSLLPKYKGLNTHARALKRKEKFGGCSVHFVTPKLDSGKIILQKKVKILKRDNENSLSKKVLKAEHKAYSLALNTIC